MTFWTWASDHPWLAFWLMFWMLVFVCQMVEVVFVRLPNRILRSRNIRARGWPPGHLDADGDFRPIQE